MRKWTKTAGLLFLAASAVYSDPVSLADEAAKEKPASIPAPAPTRDAFAKLAAVPAAAKAEAHPTTAPAAAPVVGEVVESEPVVVDAPSTSAGTGTLVGDSPVKVSDAGTVEIHVNDANIGEVLRM